MPETWNSSCTFLKSDWRIPTKHSLKQKKTKRNWNLCVCLLRWACWNLSQHQKSTSNKNKFLNHFFPFSRLMWKFFANENKCCESFWLRKVGNTRKNNIEIGELRLLQTEQQGERRKKSVSNLCIMFYRFANKKTFFRCSRFM